MKFYVFDKSVVGYKNIIKNKIIPSLVILKTELNIVDKIFIDSPPYP